MQSRLAERPMLQSEPGALRVEAQIPDISIVVPTFNERDNVAEIVRRLDASLKDRRWEVIFVDDDSTDGTAQKVRDIARKDWRVRCVQRIGRRGLSSACVEGMMASSAPYLAVMDADGQHDETILAEMLDILKAGDTDIVIGSRYVAGGGIGAWQSSRAKMSQFATWLSRVVVKRDLSDPMSGFFALRREALEGSVRNLSQMGFKILLDIVASSPAPPRVKEVPYQFRTRHAGESKLDSQAMWDYMMLLADKLFGHVVPVRFVAFGLVGAVGIVVHFAVLTTLFRGMSLPFLYGQAAATFVATTSNFALNNALTYRDMRLKGWGWLKGWFSFALVCSLGALANVGISSYLFIHDTTSWVFSALAGIAIGAVWNYAVTAVYTWKKPSRK